MATEPRTRPHTLGDSQRWVLTRMHRHGGTWNRSAPWKWESSAWTIRILQTLALQELVQETGHDTFTLTRRGRLKAAAIRASH